MSIDFSKVDAKEQNLEELAKEVTPEQLRQATNASVDYLISIVKDLSDAQVVFEPNDENANDPYAKEGEEEISWNVAHLIAHVTASSEEGAALFSLFGRGFKAEERPRYETPWKEITTVAQCVQRLEESKRIRNGYLDAVPDQLHLDVYRNLSPRFEEAVGKLNAVGSFLLGLWHETGHVAQIEEAIRQAKAAE